MRITNKVIIDDGQTTVSCTGDAQSDGSGIDR